MCSYCICDYANTLLSFGKVDSGQFFINAEASITSSLKDTEKLAIKMEESILAELSDDELDSLHTNVGVTFKDLNSYELEVITYKLL